MRRDLLDLADELTARGEPFVLATVVRREAPSSAHAGDSALVTRDGAFHGWLGGSCTRPVVVREALRALGLGTPRLINLSRDPAAERRPGTETFEITCHSGGTVEVFLDPVLPAPRLVVFGASPAARALARMGDAMDYQVHVVDPEADDAGFPRGVRLSTTLDDALPPGAYVVVATIGEWDVDAIETAQRFEPAYVGVIASRQRFAQLREVLAARGVDARVLSGIRSPAGLDIGAESPEEIALSIMAEIVATRRTGRPAVPGAPAPPPADTDARDPVCGMTVNVATARFSTDLHGTRYYFCCEGCRERFRADPDRYLRPQAAASQS